MIPFYCSKTVLSDCVCIVSETVYLIIVYVNGPKFKNLWISDGHCGNRDK